MANMASACAYVVSNENTFNPVRFVGVTVDGVVCVAGKVELVGVVEFGGLCWWV